MKMIKLLLVDDNVKFLDFAKEILCVEKDIEIIGEAKNGEEAILKTKELKPDIVLMDMRMPKLNGLDATGIIKQKMPDVAVIILTIYDIDEYREAAIIKGASGFVVKKRMKTELMPAIRKSFESRNV